MKRIIATIGLLMLASASFGSDGQHTGVGGNPALPPPNPNSTVLPPWAVQMIVNPGVLSITPNLKPQDATGKQKASGKNENDQKRTKAKSSSAQ